MIDSAQDDVRAPVSAQLVEGQLDAVDGCAGARPHLRISHVVATLEP